MAVKEAGQSSGGTRLPQTAVLMVCVWHRFQFSIALKLVDEREGERERERNIDRGGEKESCYGAIAKHFLAARLTRWTHSVDTSSVPRSPSQTWDSRRQAIEPVLSSALGTLGLRELLQNSTTTLRLRDSATLLRHTVGSGPYFRFQPYSWTAARNLMFGARQKRQTQNTL